jgi:GDPmannose 4,6-dehydratase
MMQRHSNPNFENLDYLDIRNDIEIVDGDLTDEGNILHLINRIRPNELYNLAAQSHVGMSFEQPRITAEVTGLGVLHILEAIRTMSPRTRFYGASTSELFGKNHTNGIQSLETQFHPRSPYACAKLYAHSLTINYREAYGLHACCGILFNHESEIRGKEFVTRKITDGVARIKHGKLDKLSLGNLDARRDWGHAEDYVDAMWRMLQTDVPKEYVVATGETHTVREFVELAFAEVGIKDWEKYVQVDPRFMRPSEVDLLCGDATQARTDLGWSPKVTFRELVRRMVAHDLALNTK